MSFPSRAFAAAILLGLSSSAFAASGRVVIIGFDGADARLVEQWMDEGKLPNLEALRREGTYSPLMPTNPPQTPVSWSTFATGTNPGKTEIFDFLKRQPNTYVPAFAMVDETRKPFLFGPRNPLVFGLTTALSLAVILLVGLLVLRRGLVLALGAAGLVAVVAGGTVFAVAKRSLPEEVPDAV